MKSLTEQAKEIAKKFWDTEGGFVFCMKGKAIFCAAECASVHYDDFAFRIHYGPISAEFFIRKIVSEMRVYCGVHQLVFTEK